MREAFAVAGEALPDALAGAFYLYRGDGFQGLLSRADRGLHAGVVLRACLRASPVGGTTGDARIAIGIGRVNYLPADGNTAEADGEAFDLSGPVLDRRKQGEPGLLITTPDEETNAELRVEAALIDTIIQRWTAAQAQAILESMRGLSGKEISARLSVSQAAVSQRLTAAKAGVLHMALERFAAVVRRLEQEGRNHD